MSIAIGPYKISPELYTETRAKVIDGLRKAVGDSGCKGAGAVVEGGHESYRHDTDHENLFRQESNFLYLFGVNEPDCYGLLDIERKEGVLFIPRRSPEYSMWCGVPDTPDDYKRKYGPDAVHFVDEMPAVIRERGLTTLHTMSGTNTDSRSEVKPADLKAVLGEGDDAPAYTENRDHLWEQLCEARVIKTARELEALAYVIGLSSNAHIDVMQRVRPGMMEYQLESIFKHHTSYKGGSRYDAYTCICGAGSNGAVLHYGHAGAPNGDRVGDDDMLLLDMGAEYHGYCSDITCSFPSSGKFSDDHRIVYQAVYDAQRAVEAAVRPGVLWGDMHRLAEVTILRHLVAAGIVVDGGLTPEQLVDGPNLGSVFMPHGLGHFMGLDTHDVGGYPKGVERPKRFGASALRTNRVLEAGMVLTIEPGCYFIAALLDAALADPDRAKYLNADVINRFRSFGGVRLEDDVSVSETGCINYTKVPRTIEEVEKCMAEGREKYGPDF